MQNLKVEIELLNEDFIECSQCRYMIAKENLMTLNDKK